MSHPCCVAVLRLGHRPARDKRVTTHVCLTARAFGAKKAYVPGKKDENLEKTIEKVVERWGGDFKVYTGGDWKKILGEWRKRGGLVVHLTMYGIPIEEKLSEIRATKKPLLVVVGSEKVRKEVYYLSDYNVAVGNQPHSEVAALAVFLDRLRGEKGLPSAFPDAKLRVIPQARGKKVVSVVSEPQRET